MHGSIKPGTRIKYVDALEFRHTFGRVVRWDRGDPCGWPFYVIDIGKRESVKVPQERVTVVPRPVAAS